MVSGKRDPHFFIHSSTDADLCFDLNVPENSTITLLEDKLQNFAVEGTIFAPFSGNKKYFSNFIIKNGSNKLVLIDKKGISSFKKDKSYNKNGFLQVGDLLLDTWRKGDQFIIHGAIGGVNFE